jgi:hypothetical protein
MRLLLESHPAIECVDEMDSYLRLAQASRPPTDRLVGYKIPIWTEQLDQPVLRLNELTALRKSGPIVNFYAAHKIVFMLRNPLDVVASMMELRVGGWQWLKDECLPVMETLLRDREFQVRYEVELKLIRESASRNVGMGALYWKWKTGALIRYSREGLPIHPVVYEQLVVEPATAMREVLAFLCVEWHADVLHHHRQKHGQVMDGKAIGGTDVRRAVDGESLGKWHKVLAQNEVELVLDISASLMRELMSVAAGTRHWLGYLPSSAGPLQSSVY